MQKYLNQIKANENQVSEWEFDSEREAKRFEFALRSSFKVILYNHIEEWTMLQGRIKHDRKKVRFTPLRMFGVKKQAALLPDAKFYEARTFTDLVLKKDDIRGLMQEEVAFPKLQVQQEEFKMFDSWLDSMGWRILSQDPWIIRIKLGEKL